MSAVLPSGHTLPACPACGSRACLVHAPGLVCRHTRQPRRTPTPVPPQATRKAHH